MKKLLLALLLTISVSAALYGQQEKQKTEEERVERMVQMVEKRPNFHGEPEFFVRWMYELMEWPAPTDGFNESPLSNVIQLGYRLGYNDGLLDGLTTQPTRPSRDSKGD